MKDLPLPAQVPIMALSNALLFPHALLPLHIFEDRYRKMLALALATNRMFCVALVKPGFDEAFEDEEVFSVAGIGLIRACVGRPDGTSDLVLQGLTRVEFTGFAQTHPFRIARIRPIESEAGDSVESDALAAKVTELCRKLSDDLPLQLQKHLAHLGSPEMSADLIAHTFLRDPLRRQHILEETRVPARLRMLIQYLKEQMQEA